MSNRNFQELLKDKFSEGKFVCVGLDSDLAKIPPSVKGELPCLRISRFNSEIIRATKDLVCAYKPNFAFYEAHGADGILALRETIGLCHFYAPTVPVILDPKRADIGNTNIGSVAMAFDFLNADAITVNPYLGADALEPFLEQKDKGVIVLCRTSNPGADEFQDLDITVDLEEGDFLRAKKDSWHMSTDGYHAKLYEHVAYRVSQMWNKNRNCSLVVGATVPYQLGNVRKIIGDMPILIPGIGAQGGDLEKTLLAGKDSHGTGMIINSSRGIIFACSGPDFAEVAEAETKKLHDSITSILKGAAS